MNFIKKIIEVLTGIAKTIENTPLNFNLWAFSFLALIAARLFIEGFLFDFTGKVQLLYEFSHTFLFFLISFIVFVFLIQKINRNTLKEASNIMLFGYLIILTPPIFDFIISNGKGFWSFYKFDDLQGLFIRFLTFFGDNPAVGMTYGVRIEVAISMLLLSLFTFLKTRKIWRASLMILLSYCLFFILGTFPSWIAIALKGFSSGFLNVDELDTAQLFLTSATLFGKNMGGMIDPLNIKMSLMYSILLPFFILLLFSTQQKENIKSFLLNIRFPQIFYHLGLLIVGIVLSLVFTHTTPDFTIFNIASIIVLFESVALAWITSVIINDLFDEKIDAVSNQNRPLVTNKFSPSEYKTIGAIMFFFSIFFATIVNPTLGMLLVAYQSVAFLYSAYPFRLKRFPIVGTFISAIASLIVIICGFILASPTNTTELFSTNLMWLFIVSFTLSLPLKDLKDIAGDKKDEVFTIPVIFGEYWAKIIIGSGIFISYMLSVILIGEYSLLYPALALGGLSFWIVMISNQNADHKITYRNIFWWLLAPIFVYGIFLGAYLF